MAGKRTTMADIANELGISKNAVSLALRGKEGISEGLRRRIVETASALQYGGLQQQKLRGCILALIPRRLATVESGAFYQQLCFHMEAYAQSQGLQLIISSVSEAEEENPRPPALLGSIRCIGLMTIGNLSKAYCTMIGGLGLRYVMVDQYYDSLIASSVTTANTAGAYQLTEHLIENGHSNIQFFGMRFRTASLNDRWAGYFRAMHDHKLPILRNTVTWCQDAGGATERSLVKSALDQLEALPTAVVCGHDNIARDVILTLGERGLRCPEDVSVVGFDNIQTPEVLALNLTTYHTPKVNIAHTAIDLFMQTENDLPRKVSIFGEIVFRSSVHALGSV